MYRPTSANISFELCQKHIIHSQTRRKNKFRKSSEEEVLSNSKFRSISVRGTVRMKIPYVD